MYRLPGAGGYDPPAVSVPARKPLHGGYIVGSTVVCLLIAYFAGSLVPAGGSALAMSIVFQLGVFSWISSHN